MTSSTQAEPVTASSPLHSQEAASPTAGLLLRQARRQAGVHLAVLSVTLKVPVREFEALEADKLDPAKGPAFYRGLAASVCRHLQTDPAPVLALLPQALGHLDPLRSIDKTRLPDPVRHAGHMSWQRTVRSKVFWWATLMLVLTAALLWMPEPSESSWLDDVKALFAQEPVDTELVELAADLPSVSLSVAASEMVSEASEAVLPEASVPVSDAGVSSVTPTSLPALAPNVSAPEWVFSASAESWIEVRNAQKAVVWSGLLKAGESTRIQSPMPVSVVVGRAQVVTVTLRGQPFDLKPHTQVTVARFEVKE